MNNQTEQLEQILRNLKQDNEARPSASFRTNARIRVLNTVYDQKQAISTISPHPSFLKFAFRIAAIVLFLSGGTLVYAAQSSNPGSALYRIKVASERTALTLSPPGPVKTEVAATIISRRADEIVHAQKEGNESELQQSVTSYKKTVGEMLRVHSVSRDAIEREATKHDQLIKEAESDREDATPSGTTQEPTTKVTDQHQTENSENVILTPTPTAGTREINTRESPTENHYSRESDN